MRTRTKNRERRSRWSAWAGELAGRHHRLISRPPGLERVLARPREVGQVLRERWLLAARHVQPQVHLAIQPVLRQTFWRSAVIVRESRPGVAAEVGRETARRPGEGPAPLQAIFQVSQVSQPWAAPAPLPPLSAAPLPPLQAVFQRLRAADPASVSSTSASGILASASSERAAGAVPGALPQAIDAIYQRLHAAARREAPADPRRIARRLRRTEEPVFTPPPRVQRPAAALPPSPAQAPPGAVPPGTIPAWAAAGTASAAASGNAFRSGQGWSMPATPATPAPPSIDVTALADRVMQQIGRRVEAWRERTGNL